MRWVYGLAFLALLTSCSGVPKFNTAPPSAPHSKGLKPVGFLESGSLQPRGLERPSGIAVDPSGNIYLADSQNKRVQFLDLNLNFVSLIQPAETLDFHGLGNTYDLAASYTGELF